MVVPMNAPVKLATFSAENDLCEAVIAGEDALPAGWTCVDYPPANKLGLHFHEEFLRNDGFMIVLDVVLWHRAVVLDTLLGEEVRGVGLLQQDPAPFSGEKGRRDFDRPTGRRARGESSRDTNDKDS